MIQITSTYLTHDALKAFNVWLDQPEARALLHSIHGEIEEEKLKLAKNTADQAHGSLERGKLTEASCGILKRIHELQSAEDVIRKYVKGDQKPRKYEASFSIV